METTSINILDVSSDKLPNLITSVLNNLGNAFGDDPTANFIPFSNNKEMPIAVINNVILGEFLKGLYATFSIITPHNAAPIIDIINVGSKDNPKFFPQYNPMNAPII